MDDLAINPLTYLDIAVITIVMLSTMIGFFRGFIASSMSMMGWALSICLTYILFPKIAPYLEGQLHHPVAVVVVGYMSLTMALLMCFGMLNVAFCNATSSMRQGIVDRFLGAGLGAFRGLFIIAVIFLSFVMVINLLQGHDELADDANIKYKWIVNANTYNVLVSSKDVLTSALPNSLSQDMQQFYDDYLNSKTTDERFVAYAIDKLSAKLAKNIIDEVEKDITDKSLIMSEHDLEIYHLQQLMKAYHATGHKGQPALTKSEVARVSKILNQNYKSHSDNLFNGIKDDTVSENY